MLNSWLQNYAIILIMSRIKLLNFLKLSDKPHNDR